MCFEEEEEAYALTLLVVHEVSVYKIHHSQRLVVTSASGSSDSCKEQREIRLEDPSSSELFAACIVYLSQCKNSMETLLDSSQYFALKIDDGCASTHLLN